MERTLERLLQVQAAMEELAVALEQAEGVRDAWEPVGDLFIDSLQDHIDATKVMETKNMLYLVTEYAKNGEIFDRMDKLPHHISSSTDALQRVAYSDVINSSGPGRRSQIAEDGEVVVDAEQPTVAQRDNG
ncbi:Dystrophin-related protein 2 [Liparis tanakae]|uniref:Dystrophin-related protein 2 n=1 Tax=Liparis tanakae TaxID=230148 RepID=A0A4Z2I4I4_9TELE|nr:Dystrophin-related protein 2 [Liparis tanakae]